MDYNALKPNSWEEKTIWNPKSHQAILKISRIMINYLTIGNNMDVQISSTATGTHNLSICQHLNG